MFTIKGVEQSLSEELFDSLIGMYIYVPINPLSLKDETSEQNIWFGGLVAGFEIVKVKYDFSKSEYTDEYSITYSIVMTEGVSYLISDRSEIQIITEDELNQLMVEYAARQVIASTDG